MAKTLFHFSLELELGPWNFGNAPQ
jgi:hypothetical protein